MGLLGLLLSYTRCGGNCEERGCFRIDGGEDIFGLTMIELIWTILTTLEGQEKGLMGCLIVQPLVLIYSNRPLTNF